ncbi:hypothetical protein [Sulfitobacter sp.]|uniref:hypothetical protein n=1 Tax=Sulfitobacter sp. TaxID=1903071 RepID=UPI0030024802
MSESEFIALISVTVFLPVFFANEDDASIDTDSNPALLDIDQSANRTTGADDLDALIEPTLNEMDGRDTLTASVASLGDTLNGDLFNDILQINTGSASEGSVHHGVAEITDAADGSFTEDIDPTLATISLKPATGVTKSDFELTVPQAGTLWDGG